MTPTDNIKNFDFNDDFWEFTTPLNFQQTLYYSINLMVVHYKIHL